MKKAISMFAAIMCFAVAAFAQDTLVVKVDNKTDTVFCKITKVTSMNVFYTENNAGNKVGKTIQLKDVVYHSNVKAASPNGKTASPNGKTASSPVAVKEKPKKSAGDELITSTRHFYIGAILEVAGGGLAALGTSDSIYRMGLSTPLIALGGTISLIGGVFILESRSHIGKAGKILNQ